MTKSTQLDATKRLMAALGRMPPKPHEEMKLGKSKPSLSMTPKLPKKKAPHKRG